MNHQRSKVRLMPFVLQALAIRVVFGRASITIVNERRGMLGEFLKTPIRPLVFQILRYECRDLKGTTVQIGHRKR